MTTTLLKAAVAAAAILTAMPAAAQVRAQPGQGAAAGGQPDRSAARIIRLENAVRDLQGAVYSAEGGAPVPPPDYAAAGRAPGANTVVQIQRLEQQLAEMTGRIEELTFRLATQQRQVDTMMEVMAGGALAGAPGDASASAPSAPGREPRGLAAGGPATAGPQPSGGPADLRGTAPLAPAAAPTTASVPEGPAVAVDLPADPDAAYDVAYEALLAGDYERSQAAFEQYLAAFPEEVRTPEAKYLLGEIYLATGAYSKAATQFLEHVRAYPDDPRAPEAYLKLGTSFARLDKTDEACRVFTAGASKFPDASTSVKGRLASEQAKAGCAG